MGSRAEIVPVGPGVETKYTSTGPQHLKEQWGLPRTPSHHNSVAQDSGGLARMMAQQMSVATSVDHLTPDLM